MRAVAAVGGLLAVVLMILVLAIGADQAAMNAPSGGGCVVAAGGATRTSGDGIDATLDPRQVLIARTIVAVGKGMGVGQRGTAIALGVAMQESSLNPAAVSGRSIGLFQQQGELYAAVRRTDPADSSRAFYEQLIRRVPQYNDPAAVSFANAAQTVQASGAGAALYAKWEQWAVAVAATLYGSSTGGEVTCTPGGRSGPIGIMVNGPTVTLPVEAGVDGTLTFPHDRAATAATAALSYLGTPYAWGGGTATGPSKGISDGGVADAHGDLNKIGFDCSGLMVYAFAQAGIALPRRSQEQQQVPRSVPWDQAQPGDMLFWGRPATHVALYLGTIKGVHYMVEAPSSGQVVRVSPVRTRDPGFDALVVRPW